MVQKIYAFTSPATTFTVPADWNNASNRIICIGGGGGGRRATAAAGSAGGGGGGGWAERSNTTLTPGSAVTISVGIGGTGATTTATNGGTGGQAWIRVDGGITAPTTAAQGLLAAGGLGGGTGTTPTAATSGGLGGGANIANIGAIIVTGSVGGAGTATAGSGGGGGGIAASFSPQVGGAGFAGASGGGGGGAGQGGGGSASTSSIGGTGGLGIGGSAGGAGGNAANGTAGTNGAGGGGGAGRNNLATGFVGGAGGAGAAFVVTHSTGISGAVAVSTAVGPGGAGGGGGGNSTASSTGGTGGSSNATAAFGAGGGGGGYGTLNSGNGGTGGLALIIIIYNTTELYWRGGSGTWDNASSANWSFSSGGASAGIVPTSIYDVVFDANSDTGAGYTVTIGTGAACKNLTFTAPDQTVTLAGSPNITIAASMTLTATRLNVGTWIGNFDFTATTTGFTVTTAGNTLNGIRFTGSGGGWTLQDGVTCNGLFEHTAGTLALNNQAITCNRLLLTSSTTRTLNYGTTSTITITGNNSTIIDGATLTGLTISGTVPTHTLNYSGATGTRTISFGSTAAGSITTYPPIAVTAGTDSITFTTSSSIGSINFTGFSGTWTNSAFNLYGSLTVSSGMTVGTGANTLTFSNTSGTATVNSAGKTFDFPVTQSGVGGTVTLGANLTLGSSRTFSHAGGTLNVSTFILSTTIFSTDSVNTRNLTFGAGGYIAVTGSGATVWNSPILTGLTVTGTSRIDFTYSGSVGTRTIYHGFTSGGSTTTVVNFNITAGSDTVAVGGWAAALNFTGFSGTWSNNTLNLTGNLTTPAIMTVGSGTNTLTFSNTSGTATITSNGKLFDFPITQSGGLGTVALGDNLTLGTTKTFSQTQGTLNVGTFILSTGIFSTDSGSPRNLTFGVGGYIAVTGSGTTVWNSSTVTNLTITGTSRVDLTYSGSVGTRTITHGTTGGSETNSVIFNFTAGSDTVTFVTLSNARSINFTGFSGTWTNTTTLYMYGSLTVSSGMTVGSGTGTVVFSHTSGTATITSNGKLFDFQIAKSTGTTSTLTLGDNLTMGSTRVFNLSAGILDISTRVLSTGIFSTNNANTRNITFGVGGYIAVTGNNTTVWDGTTATGLTITGTPRIDFTYNSSVGTRTIVHGTTGGSVTTAINGINITAGSDIISITTSSWIGALNFTGFSGTWTNTAFNIIGNLTTSTGMTVGSGTNALSFVNTSGTATITSNGKTFDFPVIRNAAGGTTALSGNLTLGTTRTFTLTLGTLDVSTFKLSTGIMSANNTNVKSIVFGSGGYIEVTGNNGTVWDFASHNNLGTSGTTRIDFIYSGSVGTRTIDHGSVIGQIRLNMNITAGSDTVTFTSNGKVGALNFTGFIGTWTNTVLLIDGDLTVVSPMTLGAGANTVTFSPSAGTTLITSNGKTFDFPVTVSTGGGISALNGDLTIATRLFTLTQGTFSLNDYVLYLGSQFSSSNANTRSISTGAGGSGVISSSAIGTVWDMSTATGFTVTGGSTILQLNLPTNTASSRTVNHATVAGGSEAIAITAKVQAGTGAVTLAGYFTDVNLNGFTGNLLNSTRFIYGDLILNTGMTVTAATEVTTFAKSSGSQFLTSNSVAANIAITKTGAATLFLSGNFTGGTNTNLILTQGRIDLTNITFTVNTVSTSNTNTRGFDFGTTGRLNILSGGSSWNAATSTGFTITGTSGTIDISNSTTGTFAGGGYAGYPKLNISGTGGLTISGSNTFNTLSNTVNTTLTLTSATTTTVTNFLIEGLLATRFLIRSTTAGSQATLSKPSGTVSAYYLDLKDNNATGGASWNYDNLTGLNSGNVTGWNFIALAGLPSPGRFITFFYGI